MRLCLCLPITQASVGQTWGIESQAEERTVPACVLAFNCFATENRLPWKQGAHCEPASVSMHLIFSAGRRLPLPRLLRIHNKAQCQQLKRQVFACTLTCRCVSAASGDAVGISGGSPSCWRVRYNIALLCLTLRKRRGANVE